MGAFFYKSNRLQQLRGFVCAAQVGNISKAARTLKVSPATVSVQVKSLERDLGVELFTRTGPKIVLTSAGQRLLEVSLPFVEGLEELPRLFQDAQTKHRRAELKIAANSTSLNFILPQLLKKLLKSYPELYVNIYHAEHDEAVEKIRNREVELALLPLRTHKPIADDLKFIECFKYRPSLITRRDHPLAGRRKLTVKEISQFELTLPSQDLRVIPNLYEIFPQHNIEKRLRISFVNWETTRKYIEAGLAISISSDVIIGEKDVLVATPLSHLFADVSYGFLVSKHRELGENATRILEISKEKLKSRR